MSLVNFGLLTLISPGAGEALPSTQYFFAVSVAETAHEASGILLSWFYTGSHTESGMMRRTLLLSLAVSIVSIGIGHAADMSVKAQRAVASPPTLSWSGFYIGANGGWGWSDYNISESPFGTTGIEDLVSQSVGTRANGGVFGGQIGYNWQFTPYWMLGIEGDYDGASINGSRGVVFPSILAPGNTNGFFATQNIRSLASIRGRIGYTWGPALFYFTGGGAWENVSTNAIISGNTGVGIFGDSAAGSFSTARSGFVIGGGIEYLVAQNWTVRGEYLHYDFTGSNGNELTLANCSVANCGVNLANVSNNVDVFRLGANYKFGWSPY